MPERIESLELIKVQLKSLKEGSHNSGASAIMICNITGVVEKKIASWEQLDTSESELKEILERKILQERGVKQEIRRFLQLWREYCAGKKEALADLLKEFRLIKKALDEHRIMPADLQPDFPAFEYFKLNELVKEQDEKC